MSDADEKGYLKLAVDVAEFIKIYAGYRITDYDIASLGKEAFTKVAQLYIAVSEFKSTGSDQKIISCSEKKMQKK